MEYKKEHFGQHVFAFVAIIASLIIALSVLKGGMVSYMKIIALLFPFVFMIMLSLRPVWHVFYFALIASEAMVVPIYGLKKFTPLLIVLGATSIAVVLDTLIRRSPYKVKWDTIDRWVFALGVLVTGRFIYDRPGFIGLGSAEGGFMTSLTYCSPVWFYFIIRPVIGAAVLTRKQIKFVAVMAFITIFWTLVFGTHYEATYIGRRLTNSPTWLFCAASLTLVATSPSVKIRTQFYYIWVLFFLGVGMLSGYRSRIFFFLAEISVIALFARRLKKTIAVAGVAGVLGIGGLLVSGAVPEAAARVLSLFTTVEAVNMERMGGAMGWEDNFRLQLYQYAWDEIIQSPLVGHGFGLNVQEALGVLSVTTEETAIEMLALGRSYHNSIVALAVAAGLPASIIFSVIGLFIPIRLIKQLLTAPPSDVRTWGIALLAFWAANTGMLLMNGGPREFFAQMIVTGLIAAVSTTKQEALAAEDKPVESSGEEESLNTGDGHVLPPLRNPRPPRPVRVRV